MAPLLEFKAGRCQRRSPDSNWVDPKPGKGLVYLTEEDGLTHFCYKDLETNEVDDLIVFPGDAKFVKASARVHCLRFSSSSSRHFYWMQDVDGAKDEEHANKVNEIIGAGAALEDDDAMMTESAPVERGSPRQAETDPQEQLQRILTGLNSATGGSQAGSSSQQQQQDQLRQFFQQQQQQQQQQDPEYLLSDVVTPQNAQTVLSAETMQTLLQFLPPDVPQTQESVRRAIMSPEFRRAVASLDRALRTGALGPMMRSLGMREEDARGVTEWIEGVKRQSKEDHDQEMKD